MGRRTKFQTEDKAQLVLKVSRPGRVPEESSTATANEVSAVKPIELPKVHILHFLPIFTYYTFDSCLWKNLLDKCHFRMSCYKMIPY